jgi:hypothetical protein
VPACCHLIHLAAHNAGEDSESLGGKREWSILQSLESTTRDQHADRIDLREVDEYHLIRVAAPAHVGHGPIRDPEQLGDAPLRHAALDEPLERGGGVVSGAFGAPPSP